MTKALHNENIKNTNTIFRKAICQILLTLQFAMKLLTSTKQIRSTQFTVDQYILFNVAVPSE